ncbi:SDR family oxidoreductase [Acidovorax sp. D2M1]|uniref:SDR family oxidoreductase n=1 Tax=Acidovorax benzenivorans TaxID=2987520 RepID=A0ABT5S443_9BURK|nr:SDR family NAD(P)-dependent oxidoreductase [Acidovorax benzenivorans]MDD2180737.1 SDR family oxidoreductase [Acidovorax benzenivorans]
MKTVLITGCSSGYGLATARHFHAMGWNVIVVGLEPCPNAAQQCGCWSGRTEYITGWFVHGLLNGSF